MDTSAVKFEPAVLEPTAATTKTTKSPSVSMSDVVAVFNVATAEVAPAAIDQVPITVPEAVALRTVPLRVEPTGAVPTAAVIARTRASNGIRITAVEVVATAPVTVIARSDGAEADIFDLQVKLMGITLLTIIH
jgi:hypothetical protein